MFNVFISIAPSARHGTELCVDLDNNFLREKNNSTAILDIKVLSLQVFFPAGERELHGVNVFSSNEIEL